MSKKILLILSSNKGTMAMRALDLQNALSDIGCAIQVVSVNKKIDDGIDFDNCIYYNSNNNILIKNIMRVFWLRRIKRKFKPEISISVLNVCSRVSILSGGKDYKIGQFRAPVEQNKGKLNNFIDRLSFYLFYNKLDRLFCVSKEVQISIQRNFKHIKEPQIETVYNLYNFDKIRFLAKQPTTKLNDNAFTFISVGRIEKIKGQARLIRALSLIPEKLRNNIRILFVGETDISYNNDKYFDKLIEMSKSLNVDENIFFTGHQNNPYNLIAESDCFVLSSYEEGLPGALIESLIIGKPSISTNCSLGVWEIMDVEKLYDPFLKTVFKTNSGYITSNLYKASSDLKDEVRDINNLKDAMIYVIEQDRGYDYSCVKKNAKEKIAFKFIEKR